MKKFLGIDYGSKRVGLALGNDQARLASPLAIIPNDAKLLDELKQIVQQEGIDTLVVGLPRGLDGQETAQTWTVRRFANKLMELLNIKVIFQDEAMTTQVAEKRSNKPKSEQPVDAEAAAIILQDYLEGLET